MDMSIRPLSEPDIPVIDEILKLAYASSDSRAADLQRCLALQPDGWFVASSPDGPVGMGGALDYGAFAYIGYMAVHPQMQHRGVGSALLRHILTWLDTRGAPVSLLDASAAGYPLYLHFGFKVIDDVGQYVHPDPPRVTSLPAGIHPLQPQDMHALCQFDRPIFGSDRERLFFNLMTAFPGRSFLAADEQGQISGYLFAQTRRLGPWIATRPEAAEKLLRAGLTLSFSTRPVVIVPRVNSAGIELLEQSGFKLKDSTHLHMQRGGEQHPGQRKYIFGQTNYAFG